MIPGRLLSAAQPGREPRERDGDSPAAIDVASRPGELPLEPRCQKDDAAVAFGETLGAEHVQATPPRPAAQPQAGERRPGQAG